MGEKEWKLALISRLNDPSTSETRIVHIATLGDAREESSGSQRGYIEAGKRISGSNACQTRWSGDLLFFIRFSSRLFYPFPVYYATRARRSDASPRLLSRATRGDATRIGRCAGGGGSCGSLRRSSAGRRTNGRLRLNPLVGAGPRHAKRLVVAELAERSCQRGNLSMPLRRANEISRAPRFRLKLPADSRHARRSKRCGTSRENAVVSS